MIGWVDRRLGFSFDFEAVGALDWGNVGGETAEDCGGASAGLGTGVGVSGTT